MVWQKVTNDFIRFIIVNCILLAFSTNAFAQNFTTMGDNFWFGFMQNYGTPTLHVFISSEVNTSGTISIPMQGWTQNFTVTAGTTTEVLVPTPQGQTVGAGTFPNGIHLVADDDVAVYALNYESNTSDATVVAPVRTLGSHYYVMAYKDNQAPFSEKSEFLVVAAYDNTTIEITPSVATTAGNAANVPFQVTLSRGQVFQVQANGDLSGSLVRSFDTGNGCPNFALFSGNICTGVICAYCDHLKEQMFPTSTWGKEYLLTPLLTRANDRYRVQASINGTQISINGGAPINLNAGQHYQFNTNQPTIVTSNNPVSVTQFSLGSDCDNTSSDPFTINLSPVEQTLERITFNAFTSAIITNYYLNVVTTTANTNLVTLDGGNIGAQFNAFPSNPTYSYAQLSITQGNHTIASDSGIVAYVYGYGQDESYGYSAGANLSDLTALIKYQVGDYTEQDSIVFICPEDTILFVGEGDSSIIGWEWLMGDGTYYTGDSIFHTYGTYGTFEVMLLVERMNMCSKDTLWQIMEVTGPRINIIEADSICIGNDIQLNVSGGDAYVWSTGDSSNSIIVSPSVDTFYWVYAIDSLCPGQPDTVDITVIDIQADFSQNFVCLGDSAFFFDLSQVINDTISSWQWDFGTITTATLPYSTFADSVNQIISLNIESSFGCRDTIQKPINTSAVPEAHFTFENVCKLEEVQFTDSSSISTGNIVSWYWDFGDSTSSTIQNPVHIYDTAGIFTVQLVVSTDSSCTDTASFQVQVYELPEADFDAQSVCNGTSSVFVDASISSDGNIDQWYWDFGDNFNSTGQAQSHQYSSPGVYQTTLIVETEFLCRDTITKDVEVFDVPNADFSATNVCLNDTTTFTNASSISLGNIVNSTYTFGDGGFGVAFDTTHLYSNPGNYSVQLIVESDSACFDTIVKDILVHHLPIADFEVLDHCSNQATDITDLSSISQGSISEWDWNFGDNTSSNDMTPTHHYATADTYDIQLIVVSDSLCSDTTNRQVIVFPVPVADFEVDPLCFGNTSEFFDLSSISTGSIVSYNWNFGDNTSSNLQNPSHEYLISDTFTTTLEVISDLNCRDTIIGPAIVYSLPDVNFSFDDICLGDIAHFVDSTTVRDGQIISYDWTLSDGTTSSATEFDRLFTDTGTFSVQLITESSLGCIDSIESSIEVYELPTFTGYVDPACYGEQDGGIELIISNGELPYYVSWSDGNTDITRSNLYSGDYEVTVSDANDCWSDSSFFVSQPDEPILLTITPDSSVIVFGTELDLLATGNFDPYLSYQWENTEHISCRDCPNPTVDPLDYTIYTVEATDSIGCKGTASAEVYVDFDYIFFAPNAFSPNGDGTNDTFKVYARGVKNIRLMIFDRWGELLFATNDMEIGWDGRHDGKLLNPDVFVFHADIEYLNGFKKAHKGSLTLIR